MARRRTTIVLAALLSVAAVSSIARADDEKGSAAAEAYDKGAAALDRGDYGEAARLFAKADQLAPNAIAIEAALRAATSADNPPLAMELVAKAEERSPGASLSAAIGAAKAAFADRVGKLTIACNGCTAKLDGEPAPLDKQRIVLAGAHVVQFDVDGKPERQTVRVLPGKSVRASPKNDGARVSDADTPTPSALEVPTFDSPSDADKEKEKDKSKPAQSGLSPAWFVTGCVVTATLAGITIGSGIDTLSKHSEFDRVPTDANAAAGRAADFRTQLLGGATGASLVGTIVVGAFFVRWKDSVPVSPSAFFVPKGGGATLGGKF